MFRMSIIANLSCNIVLRWQGPTFPKKKENIGITTLIVFSLKFFSIKNMMLQ